MSEPAASSAFAYRAFISYSHADRVWCDWLHKALETYRVPSRLVGKQTDAGVIPRRLAPIFRDRDELPSATDLSQKVEQALRDSAWLIVLCSPQSARSHWVNEEVVVFKRAGRADRILCLIVEGEPDVSDIPGRAADECFCPALRHRVDASGALTDERVEPIAADARAGKDGKTNAKLKLIAGMLDVGFDALKQRELQRRNRRMAAITALALIVMTVTTVLAITAIFARNAAVAARHKAVVAEQAAERRQKQAEGLVGFMLGDLTTRLRQVDRLDILTSVDDKAMAYFKSLPLGDVNATTLAQRAKALQKIGDVRMNQSKLSDAMDAFQQALRLNERLVELSPNDASRQNAYGENLLWIGFNYWNQGKQARTEESFKQAASALQRAAALAPSDNDVQRNLDDIYNNLGHVAEARGELDPARNDYVRDLELDQRMAAAHPDDARWQTAVADAYGNMGNIELARGRLDNAIANYLRQQKLIANAVASHPGNRQLPDQLLGDDVTLARPLAFVGRTQDAIGYAQAATKIGKTLVAFDASHNDWLEDYASANELLGKLLLANGEIEAALQPIASAVSANTQLVAKDSQNAEWRTHLAQSQLEAARLAWARKQGNSAKQLALQANANIQQLLSGGSSKPDLIRAQADGDLLLDAICRQGGDTAAADIYAQRALTHLRPLAEHSLDPRILSLWSIALLATGDNAHAQLVIETLRKMGYAAPGFIAQLRSHGIDYSPDSVASQRIAAIVQPAAPVSRAPAPIHP